MMKVICKLKCNLVLVGRLFVTQKVKWDTLISLKNCCLMHAYHNYHH